MNFLTPTFFLFFAATLICYYKCPQKIQNIALLAANYVFYLWVNPALGIFLVLGTLVGYLCGRMVERSGHRRLWLVLTMAYCFGTLFTFKYLDFVCRTVLDLAGIGAAGFHIGLALPVGISFYSFSLVGYVFDVCRGKLRAERNLLRFAAFSSLFPSILSGPINRARDLLPQLSETRRFEPDHFKEGLWRFLKGAAKKLIPSSLLAGAVDSVYSAPYDFGSGMWLITVFLYSIYIYIDFSAYSDMAIGAAKMLNIQLMENFRAPYLARTVKEFWKRWHISLTSWFREYLYFPLGGSRGRRIRTWLNVLVVFAVSGIWHGAGLHFLIWGLLNGCYQVAGAFTAPFRQRLRTRLHCPEQAWYTAAFQMLATFLLITFAWIFFRSDSLDQAVFIIKRILLLFRDGFGPTAEILSPHALAVLVPALALCLMEDILILKDRACTLVRTSFRFWVCVALLAAAALIFGQYGEGFNAQDFIYFQF